MSPYSLPHIYTTCLHCHSDLGANESIEQFPVGRRLAFDQGKGRLWVICTTCSRWNLTPLEERWEAIEACERLYRDTRKRVATDEIGLAKARDGLALVRIGRPVFPEYAGWRYGTRFGRRHHWNVALESAAAAAVLGGAFALVGVPGLVIGAGALTMKAMSSGSSLRESFTRGNSLGEVKLLDGRVEHLDVHRARRARLVAGPEGTWTLGLPEYMGKIIRPCVTGEPTDRELRDGSSPDGEPIVFDLVSPVKAAEVLRRIIPTINATGGDQETVAEAVELHERWEGKITESIVSLVGYSDDPVPLAEEKLVSLALEMSVYEDQERRWLEGELYLLEAMWQEAEKIAAIADDLTLPAWVTDRLKSMRVG